MIIDADRLENTKVWASHYLRYRSNLGPRKGGPYVYCYFTYYKRPNTPLSLIIACRWWDDL